MLILIKIYYIITYVLGVWLNGRVVVSKTIGCGFKSYCPCHKDRKRNAYGFFYFGIIVSIKEIIKLY